MKVILSRKGLDSKAGGIPSPILPDGTLLSLPIPDNMSGQKYSELYYNGQSLQEIIHQLSPHFDFLKNPTCHLDPDIYHTITKKPADWKPAFGQRGIPAAHLDKYTVEAGDIFLFYGMFRQTQIQADGTFTFVKDSPIRHIIYDLFEDERVIITSQLVHGNDMPEGTIRTNEGFFADYRSYMSELWYWEHITNVTYYFPVDDPLTGHIPNDNKFIENYLIAQGKLVENEKHYMETMLLNCDGIEVYSVTITIACEDEGYCEARP